MQIYNCEIGVVKCLGFLFLFYYFCRRIRDVAQPGSVLAWGARGRWFESSHPDFYFFSIWNPIFFISSQNIGYDLETTSASSIIKFVFNAKGAKAIAIL